LGENKKEKDVRKSIYEKREKMRNILLVFKMNHIVVRRKYEEVSSFTNRSSYFVYLTKGFKIMVQSRIIFRRRLIT